MIKILEQNYVLYAMSDAQILEVKSTAEERRFYGSILPWEIVKKVFSVADALLSRE